MDEEQQAALAAEAILENPVILFDGVCGLCDRTVKFVLKHDWRRMFRFAPLQGGFASETLAKHGKDATKLEAVCVLADERLLCRSDAAIFILRRLNWPWKAAAMLKILPRRLRDVAYDWIARRRYRIFGKLEHCPIPDASVRERFIDW